MQKSIHLATYLYTIRSNGGSPIDKVDNKSKHVDNNRSKSRHGLNQGVLRLLGVESREVR